MTYSDMSNEELDRRVAIEVMGWHQQPGYGQNVFWRDADDNATANPDWSPSTNISQAWEVLGRLKQEGFNAVVDNAENEFCASFVAPNRRDADGKVAYGQAHADTAPRAICEAALTAADMTTGVEDGE